MKQNLRIIYIIFTFEEKKMFNRLLFCPLFKGISPEQIELLLMSNEHQIIRFSDREIIEFRGNKTNNLWIILEGKVKGEMIDESGKLVKIEDISSPMPLAIAFIFSEKGIFPVNICANEEVKMLRIPKASVINMMQKNQQFLQNFLTMISNKANFLSDRIYFMSFKTIRQKIDHYIIDESGSKDSFIMRSTQQELSDFFGIARPSLARIFSELEKENIIRVEKKKIEIVNRKALIEALK